MGYYIDINSKGEELQPTNKAKQLVEDGAKIVKAEFQENLVCVIENEHFDAAGYIFSEKEFGYFNECKDDRRKTWLVHPLAKKLSDYNR